MKIFYFIIIFFLCTHCAFSEKKDDTKFNLNYPKELEKVHTLIVQKKTLDARALVDDYLNKAENIHWYGHAYFLKGFLYELDQNYPESIKHYRSAIRHGSQYESKVEAKALYNLSFVYEKQDQRQELLIALLDLMKRRQHFDILTGQVEMPARLAAAYASHGKMREAKIFHREAAQNYKTMVRNQRFRATQAELSKSLYYLGFAVFDQKNVSYKSLIRKISIGQKYFLNSAEASKSTWSDKSADRLLQLYNQAWGRVLSYRPAGYADDPLALKKQTQRKQLVMSADFYDLMNRLPVEKFPLGQVNPRAKKILQAGDMWTDRIENFALNLDIGVETVRRHKVKNKKLARYIIEEKKKVKINKEQVKQNKDAKEEPQKPSQSETTLPAKQDIGKDPNL